MTGRVDGRRRPDTPQELARRALEIAEKKARQVEEPRQSSDRHVTEVAAGVHATEEGVMNSVRTGRLGNGDLIVSMVGWLDDEDLPPNAIWPEPWPVRPDAPEQVGEIVRRLNLNREQYELVCEIAEDLCKTPEFRQATKLVARALMVVPRLDHAALERLRALTAFADEPEEAAA